MDDNINIPQIRSMTETSTIDAKNLKEALEIWAYLRDTANEMLNIRDRWRRIYELEPSDRNSEYKDNFERGAHVIGETSMKVLEQILNELKTDEEVLAKEFRFV
jgi:hypothetical protein